jgi:hypothetical protein
MPGFIAWMFFSAKENVVAAALTNTSEAALPPLGLSLVGTTVDEWPVAPKAWRAGDPPPADVVPLLGVWFMEAGEMIFRWRDGKLEMSYPDAADWEKPAVFEQETPDRWRTVSGPEHGEALRIARGDDGEIVRLVWAGYPVTREPGVWRAGD